MTHTRRRNIISRIKEISKKGKYIEIIHDNTLKKVIEIDAISCIIHRTTIYIDIIMKKGTTYKDIHILCCNNKEQQEIVYQLILVLGWYNTRSDPTILI